MTEKVAIYPGSFDPITNGHVDIIKRGRRVFDKIYVAVINNPLKEANFSTDARIDLIRRVFSDDQGISVEGFNGLLVDYAQQKNVYTMIRGLRAVSDFDYEFQMALTNRHQLKKMDTVFLMTDMKFTYLSSSLIKQLVSFGGDVSELVPTIVEQALKEKNYHE